MKPLTLALALVFLTCPSADDDSATQLATMQGKIDGFLTNLETAAGTPAAAHARHVSFYGEMRSDLTMLRSTLAERDRSPVFIDQLIANIDALEEAHRKGISGPEIPVLRQIFAAQFHAIRIAGEEQ